MRRLGLRWAVIRLPPVGPLFFPQIKLRNRMVLFLALFLLLLMAVVSALGALRDRELLIQQLRDEGLALAKAYALSAENALILNGAGLARVVGEAGQAPEITFLMIVDPNGRVLAHSDPTHIGETATQPAIHRALGTAIGAVDAGRTPIIVLGSESRTEDVLEVVVPLVILDRVRGALEVGLGTDLIRQATMNTTGASFLIALAAFLLGVAFIVAFSRSLTRPLESLAEAADRIRAGTWHAPIPATGGGEIAELAGAMERMRQEVFTSFSRLKERTDEVEELRGYAQNILDSLQSGVVSLDLDGMIRGLNRHAARMLGLASPPPPGTPPALFLAPWPELAQAFEATWGGQDGVEVVLEGTDERGRPRNRLLRLHTSRLTDPAGRILGELVVIDDITFLRSLETRMRDAEKMAAMGELSAGVAHEIRNPLGSIRNAAQFLGGKLEPGDPKTRFTQLIIEEVDRLNLVVGRLLQYTKSAQPGLEVHDLRVSLEQAVVLAELRAPSSRVKLVRQVPDALPPVWADPARLVQLFLNVLFNAIEAISGRGTVTATIRAAGDVVSVTIEDTGCGMPPEVVERVGEPFFTTRETGTGLGLAIAGQIVGEHHGRMYHRSVVGQGTTVVLEFPVCEKELLHEHRA